MKRVVDTATSDLFSTSGRDEGMAIAAAHADGVTPNWTEDAYRYLCAYASLGRPFTAPEVRAYAEQAGLPEPPSLRAWGPVFHRAARNGTIAPTGRFQIAGNDMHSQPIREWIAL